MGIELWLLGIAATAAAAGAGVSVYSSIQQGKAQDAAAKAQAEQYKQQAEINQAQAEVAQMQGEKEAQRRMAILSQDIGSMYAGFAGNGVDLGSGVVGKALTTTTKEAQADLKTIEDNTRMNVWTMLNNKAQNLNAANVSSFQGSAARKAGTLGGWSAGVTGVGNTIQSGAAGYDAGTKIKNGWNS